MVPTVAHAGVTALFAEDAMALENACGAGDGCWTNYLRVTDLDGDDDLDVVAVNYQGFFESGTAEPLVVYTNDGSGGFTNTSDTSVGGFEGRIRQVAIGDVDGDGDPDMYVPDANGGPDNLFFNDGGVFTPEEQTVSSNAGAARFGDFDDDGDYDLFLADGYNTGEDVHGHIYLNDGNGGFTELDGAIPAPAGGTDPDDVDLFDADGDFDLDIMVNSHSGPNDLWLNDGGGMFSDASGGLATLPGNFHYGPSACDVDGDGDLDVWIDNVGPDLGPGVDTEMLMINDGSGAFTDETEARVSGNPDADDNGVNCLDVDYDGDFDAVVIALGTAERYLVNDGGGNFEYLAGAFMGAGASELWGEFGDVNGDGRLDLVTGAGEGATQDRVFLGTAAQMVDTTPPTFRAVQAGVDSEADTEVIFHYAIADNAVTDEGPRLSSAVVHVTVDGATEDVPAWFMGGDLFRAVLPGHPEGTVVEVEPCATDREGNEGCAEVFTYEVGVASGTDSGESTDTDSGSGSGSASDTDGTSSPTSGASVTGASATVSTTTPSSTSGDTDTDPGAGDDGGGGGCNCSTQGDNHLGWLALLFLALPLRRRRR
jgi:MYXO-CTERM domain-containing protein